MQGRSDVRIEWIDVAKALSILLVTFLHVVQLLEAAGFTVWRLVQLNTFLSPIRMPLFFAASGVFAGSALTRPWRVLLRSKVALYLWLFVVWTLVRWLFCAFVLSNPDNPAEGTAISQIAWSMVMPTTGLWFLWSLAIFFVAAKLIAPFGAGPTIALTIGLSLIAMFVAEPSNSHSWILANLAHRNTAIYFVFFYTAAMRPRLLTSLDDVRPVRALMAALTFFGLLLIAQRVLPGILGPMLRFAASVAGVAALLLLARLVDGWRPASRVLRYVGLHTLPIYVAQVPLIAMMVAILTTIGAGRLGVGVALLCPLMVMAVAWLGLSVRDLLLRIGAGWLYRLPHGLSFHLPMTHDTNTGRS